ncbi:hypothetical protein CRG98_042902 [Punica granatum]|uniref:Uncharacterized protein n=1 Tax=Punica granatum TaxID=22663 RepID=A0A2I0HYC4_PUNGR|nr:hypothetical protein CRG98_042902 [Punica granatum]
MVRVANPPRSPTSSVGTDDLGGGSDPPVDSRTGVANWRPQPLHRGRWYPWRSPATSMKRSRSPINGSIPQIDRGLEVGVPGRFECWGRPSTIPTPPLRPSISRRLSVTLMEESRSPIGVPSHESIENSNLESSIDLEVGAANWRL